MDLEIRKLFLDLPSMAGIKSSCRLGLPYRWETLRLVLCSLKNAKIWLWGTIPIPPPVETILAPISLKKNAPNGSERGHCRPKERWFAPHSRLQSTDQADQRSGRRSTHACCDGKLRIFSKIKLAVKPGRFIPFWWLIDRGLLGRSALMLHQSGGEPL